MSSTIDWSKAPEGATHYVQGSIAPWEKRDGDDWYYFRNRDRSWTKLIGPDMHGERRIEVAKLTIFARPTEPQEPTPWDGQGLPPVGTVCEHEGCGNVLDWLEVRVLAHTFAQGFDVAVFQHKDTVSYSSARHFRPIKTPEQIATEERDNAVQSMAAIFFRAAAGVANDVSFGALYDAGYRKVEQP